MRPDATEMQEHNWKEDFAKSLGVFLNGHGIKGRDPMGRKIIDNSFYIIFNAHHGSLSFTLPSERYGQLWTMVLNTADPQPGNEARNFLPDQQIVVEGNCVLLLSTKTD